MVLVVSVQVVRGAARRLALLLVVPTAVLMVGIHPADQPTPFGRLLLWGIYQRDYPLIQGTILFVALLFLLLAGATSALVER